MRNWYLLFTLLIVLGLIGCGKTAPTIGGSADSSQRKYNIPIKITNNKAPVNVTQHLYVDKTQSETSTSSGQTGATLPTTITTDVSAALAQGGATNSLVEEGGKLLLKGVTSTAKYLNERMEQVATQQKPSEGEVNLPKIQDPTMVTEPLTYHGRYNGDRATWYAAKDLKDYPQTFVIEIPGCTTFSVNAHDGKRVEHKGYIVKQSDVAGRGLGVVAPQSCQSQDATISYTVSGKSITSEETIDGIPYHHMSYGSVSAYAGNGLMQCPGDPEYDSCTIAGDPMKVNRKNDKGRTHWWPADNKKHPEGSEIICIRGGRKYQYVWEESAPHCKAN